MYRDIFAGTLVLGGFVDGGVWEVWGVLLLGYLGFFCQVFFCLSVCFRGFFLPKLKDNWKI